MSDPLQPAATDTSLQGAGGDPRPDDPGLWKVQLVRDFETERLYYIFDFPTGIDGGRKSWAVAAELTDEQIRPQLAQFTMALPRKKKEAEGFIADVIKTKPPEAITGTKRSGWKPDKPGSDLEGFATPGWVYAKSNTAQFKWLGNGPGEGLGSQEGDLKQWQKGVGALCGGSSYLAVAVMAALAVPLLKLANFSEAATFHYAGEDTTGKTTAAKVAASVMGPPELLHGWNNTARSLEEIAAGHNDLLLILNAAEKAESTDLKKILKKITHEVSEGKSSTRSKVVQDWLPDLTWRCLILSTGNLSGMELAAKAKLSWDGQERTRFITIPVPTKARAGIFDRLTGSRKARVAEAERLIGKLEKALGQSHGALLRHWVKLVAEHVSPDEIQQRIDHFVAKVRPPDVHYKRIAAKFGLLYAAGKIALSKGLLPWDGSLPYNAAARLYRRAIADELGAANSVELAALALADAVADKARCPHVKKNGTLPVDDDGQVIGARGRLGGVSIVALRQEGLKGVAGGGDRARALIAYLKAKGVLEAGHGGKRGRQLPIKLKRGGKTIKMPRFLVLDGEKFDKLAGELHASAPPGNSEKGTGGK